MNPVSLRLNLLYEVRSYGTQFPEKVFVVGRKEKMSAPVEKVIDRAGD